MSVLSHKSAATAIGVNKTITYTHGLVDGDGNALVPDVVGIEVTAGTQAQPPVIEEISRSSTTVVWKWSNATAGDTLTVVCHAQANISNQGQESTAGTVAGSGGAGTPIGPVNGSTLKWGQATVLAGQSSIAVADTNITANSVVVANVQQAVADGTLTQVLRTSVSAGVGFTIYGDANATANTVVSYMAAY